MHGGGLEGMVVGIGGSVEYWVFWCETGGGGMGETVEDGGSEGAEIEMRG